MKKSTKTALVIFAVLMVIAVAVVYITKPEVFEGKKHITVTVVFADKSEKVHEFDTKEEYLYDAIKDILTGSMEEYGFWMTGVDGVIADDSKQQWWGIYDADGEALMTGASETPIKDGDCFSLILNEGYDW